jgi:phospholipase C
VGAGARRAQIVFRNTGKSAAVFQVRSGDGQTGPWTYTVGAGDQVSDTFGSSAASSYDYEVFGPNGFLRTFAGGLAAGSANTTVHTIYDRDSGGVLLVIRNHGGNAEKVSIFDASSGKTHTELVRRTAALRASCDGFGWYDLTVKVAADASFVRQLARHVETGPSSVTDLAIRGGVWRRRRSAKAAARAQPGMAVSRVWAGKNCARPQERNLGGPGVLFAGGFSIAAISLEGGERPG